MNEQELLSAVRKGIDSFNLIDNNDKIAIGISGGKDSLSLAFALKALKRFYPRSFDLVAITVDVGFKNVDFGPISAYFDQLEIPYYIVKTDIYDIVFETRKDPNPCSLCSKMRKGALNTKAKELSCNKVAYAHNKDDLIETALMTLFFEGQFHPFKPDTYLDRTDLHVIRPMLYVDEPDIIKFSNNYSLPVLKSPCPVDGKTKREYIKNIINELSKDNKFLRENLFSSCIKYFGNGLCQ